MNEWMNELNVFILSNWAGSKNTGINKGESSPTSHKTLRQMVRRQTTTQEISLMYATCPNRALEDMKRSS